jgi:putative ABC transport system permease protein
MFSDARYAVRSLAKSPVFALTAILALALGIGAVTAIFSVVNAVLLRPLPYADPERLVMIWERSPKIPQYRVSVANFLDWKSAQRSFSAIGYFYEDQATLTSGELPERVDAATMSPGLLATLGVRVAQGREFRDDEAQAGRNLSVILTHGLWQRRFGGRADAVGSELAINGQKHQIVGVLGPDFRLIDTAPELFRPYVVTPRDLEQRGTHKLKVVARLAPGVSPERADQEMKALAKTLEERHPNWNRAITAYVRSVNEEFAGNIRSTLLILLSAVGLVLLIACANVASLLLVRAADRQKEIAIRTSIGASPWAIASQLLIESVTVALMGGIAGFFTGWLLLKLMGTLAARSLPPGVDLTPDWTVALFALAVSVLTGLLFGLAPALTAIRTDLNTVLRASGRGMVGSKAQAALRAALAVGEVALSIVLLAGAALLVRSFWKLESVDPGFRPQRVMTFKYSLPPQRYDGPAVPRFHERLLERVRALPGVEVAGATRDIPLSGDNPSLNFQVEGRPSLNPNDDPSARFRIATPGYAEALGLKLVSGRFVDATDGAEGKPPGCMINATNAKTYFADRDPIGQRIRTGFDNSPWCTIRGVVGDVRHRGLATDAQPEVFYTSWALPVEYLGFTQGTTTITVRASGDPAALTSALRNELRGLDPEVAIFNARTMEAVVESSVAQPRFRTLLIVAFAGLALALTIVGLYGVISYSVSQRMQEMSVRMALGAQAGDLMKMVVGQGMKLASIGAVIGLAAAFFLARLVKEFLFGVEPYDWMAFALAAFGVMLVTVLATLAPAWRAAQADPAHVINERR